MQELDETGCIIIADWKMKFLSHSFREAMSDFFGKAGMPWHGTMIIRRARPQNGETVNEGEYVCSCGPPAGLKSPGQMSAIQRG